MAKKTLLSILLCALVSCFTFSATLFAAPQLTKEQMEFKTKMAKLESLRGKTRQAVYDEMKIYNKQEDGKQDGYEGKPDKMESHGFICYYNHFFKDGVTQIDFKSTKAQPQKITNPNQKAEPVKRSRTDVVTNITVTKLNPYQLTGKMVQEALGGQAFPFGDKLMVQRSETLAFRISFDDKGICSGIEMFDMSADNLA